MIRASAAAERLIQRLRSRATRLANARVQTIRRDRRKPGASWRSAAALWPDLFGDDGHGK